MENSDTELKGFSTTKKSENTLRHLSPDVTVNQIFYVNPHHCMKPSLTNVRDGFIPNCCRGSDHFCQKIPCTAGQVNQAFRQPVCAAQHKGLMQHGEPEDGGATPARMKFYPGDTRPNQCGTTGPADIGASR